MSKVVFYYFPVKALGEPSRLLMAYGGQEFEDRRISKGEGWDEFKPKTPFGQMPVLEMDGKLYAQSYAIARYFGTKFGLAGDNLEEALEIDQNVYLIEDLRAEAAEVAYECNEEIKEKKHADHEKTVYPTILDKLNEIIVKNNGHIALGKLTWGDFVFAGMLDYLKRMLRMPDLEEKYPAFKQVVKNVYSIPKVKAYADAAPETVF
ncbi:glutathione S-transferase 2 [Helicoverpa armigera]|uniref:glutathione S-transferase 2 n=1 Tax=Helicoverpa armigera TaxID=29058 RepID=UPI003082D6AC